MKIQKAGTDDQAVLLSLMRESFELETEVSHDDWAKTEAAVKTLLIDPYAGEAYLTYDDQDDLLGYIIMCRGFSLDYGGYFLLRRICGRDEPLSNQHNKSCPSGP